MRGVGLLSFLIVAVIGWQPAMANMNKSSGRIIHDGLVKGVFQARLLGLDIIQMSFSIDMKNRRYLVENETTSDGIVGFLFDYGSVSRAEGRITDQGFIPDSFDLHSQYWGNDYKSTLIYDGNGAVLRQDVMPDHETDNREPVTADQYSGSQDPASTIMNFIANGVTPGDICAQERKLYDGFRLTRFWGVETTEQRPLSDAQPDVDIDSVIYCEAEGELIAGRRLDKEPDPDRKNYPPARIWFAEPNNTGIIMPVRFEKDTSWGMVEAQLISLTIEPAHGDSVAWQSEWARDKQTAKGRKSRD